MVSTRRFGLDDSLIIDQFKSGLSIGDISKKHNCGKSTIYRLLLSSKIDTTLDKDKIVNHGIN